MLYLLLLLTTTVSIVATEDHPAILASTPNSPVVISKKEAAKRTTILPHASRWKEQDFYSLPDRLKNKIYGRVMQFAILKHALDSQCCEDAIKQQHTDYVQWFYPHHGNLLITTVNEAVNKGASAGFLDLFEELLKIPELKAKTFAWQEITPDGSIQEKYGTITDYIALYDAQLSQNQYAQQSREILQEFLHKAQPSILIAESD